MFLFFLTQEPFEDGEESAHFKFLVGGGGGDFITTEPPGRDVEFIIYLLSEVKHTNNEM